jgi:hypothetical protein
MGCRSAYCFLTPRLPDSQTLSVAYVTVICLVTNRIIIACLCVDGKYSNMNEPVTSREEIRVIPDYLRLILKIGAGIFSLVVTSDFPSGV